MRGRLLIANCIRRRYRRDYRGEQFSFGDAWRDMSIGNLLQSEQVAWLCEEGAHRDDMWTLNGPFMAYKAHWTEIRLPIEAWISR